MKARIPKQEELVLLYAPDAAADVAEAVRTLEERRFPVRLLGAEALGETLGHLAGLPGYTAAPAAYEGSVPDTRLLVMCALPDQRLDELLSALRESGASTSIPLKAILTPTNQRWPLHALLDEVAQEHKVMEAYRRLREVGGQASKLPRPEAPSPAWDALQAALQGAMELIQAPKTEPTEADFLAATAAIEAASAHFLDTL